MFGSHLSIAGGMENALIEANKLGMGTVQVFTKNQQQWVAKPLEDKAIGTFKEYAGKFGFTEIVAHDSYLINLAAADEALREKSIAAFANEMARCDQLGIKYLVTHPGAHVGQGEQIGIQKVVAAFNDIADQQSRGQVTVCIETTAGQGTCLGCTFEQIAEMLSGIKQSQRFGVCIDTAHTLASGYDITTVEGTQKVLADFDRIVGLKHVRVLHLNDSKKPLGSRVDRHDHIGRGFVGLPAFEVICQDKRFKNVPKILETPKEGGIGDKSWDELNLEILTAFSAGKTSDEVRKIMPAAPAEEDKTPGRGDTATRKKKK